MSRISIQSLALSIQEVRAMGMGQKAQLVDELLQKQPNMLGSILALNQISVSNEKKEFLLEILLICFQAMKESGLSWPLITTDEQEKQLARYVATVKFGEDLSATLKNIAMEQYIKSHPEQYLLAFVTVQIKDWLKCIIPKDTDKYVMLAAANLVNCIAFVPVSVA